jgi:hypothetical protein
MFSRFAQSVLLAIALLFVVVARSTAANDDSPIPRESAERVLGNIRDFAGGKPSPNILYSTRDLGELSNGPASAKGPSVLSLDRPAPRTLPSASSLQGGTIERRDVAPTVITSPWR